MLTFKNMSEYPLNISADELTERFTRGDASRSTQGSGLGLSIAKNLTQLQGGQFEIYLDGDLFKVTLTFPALEDWEGVRDSPAYPPVFGKVLRQKTVNAIMLQDFVDISKQEEQFHD